MATSDIIALALIVAVIIAALGYLIFKKYEKSNRILYSSACPLRRHLP